MKKPIRLFEKYGIELEYMIVNKYTLDVKPLASGLLEKLQTMPFLKQWFNKIDTSNELMQHIIELKVKRPTKNLSFNLSKKFHKNIIKINKILSKKGAMLLPTGAHPWMNPRRDAKIWQGKQQEIYQHYHAIFDCYRHGFANLQSTHINLPFGDEKEFIKLHAAIRLILPILPSLCASTPLFEGKFSGTINGRLMHYINNQQKIPSIAGKIIPEMVNSIEEYHETILRPMYQDIAPFDIQNILQHEWLNSRAAIARFDRNTIEIRIIDIQECPMADIAIAKLLSVIIQMIVEQIWINFKQQSLFDSERLFKIFLANTQNGLSTMINDKAYLAALGYKGQKASAQKLWQHLLIQSHRYEFLDKNTIFSTLETIIQKGNLSERILKKLDGNFSRGNIKIVYQQLANCLLKNKMFKN